MRKVESSLSRPLLMGSGLVLVVLWLAPARLRHYALLSWVMETDTTSSTLRLDSTSLPITLVLLRCLARLLVRASRLTVLLTMTKWPVLVETKAIVYTSFYTTLYSVLFRSAGSCDTAMPLLGACNIDMAKASSD